jgi:flagellar M-ring protein FliF
VEQTLRHLETLRASLAALGARRLALLGVVGLLTAAIVGGAAWWAGRPVWEPLYVGLDRQDAARIGSALREAGLSFDQSADGASVFVRSGEGPQARALLAERGLPHGASGGYELFDKLGSLGLTTFMQEVTRIRAIEGELARTISLLRGVRSARVHVVPADEGSFRRGKQPASASVVIRTDGGSDQATAAAVRKLVAAAVPGMTADQVTVLSADGGVLASGEDAMEAGAGRVRQLEREVARETQEAIRRTLSPLLGLDNMQVAVTAQLNADRKQIDETIYNPDSKVERSVRVVRESQSAQNAGQGQAATVERNLPAPSPRGGGDAKGNSEEASKREELTNFELSSKRVQTVSQGYAIERLTAAVVVNRAGLAAAKANGTPEQIAAELKDIEGLIASAMGLRADRGDQIKLSAVDFAKIDTPAEPGLGANAMTFAARHTGVAISSLAAIAIAAMGIFLIGKPLIKTIASAPPLPALAAPAAAGQLGGPHGGATSPIAALAAATVAQAVEGPPLDPPRRVDVQRLEQIVDMDEALAASILKQMVREEAA